VLDPVVEQAAQGVDVGADVRGGRPRRRVRPEHVDQHVRRDGGVRAHQEGGEQQARLGSAERDRVAVDLDVERPEDAEHDGRHRMDRMRDVCRTERFVSS
jgi:hypothetical protein